MKNREQVYLYDGKEVYISNLRKEELEELLEQCIEELEELQSNHFRYSHRGIYGINFKIKKDE